MAGGVLSGPSLRIVGIIVCFVVALLLANTSFGFNSTQVTDIKNGVSIGLDFIGIAFLFLMLKSSFGR